jgi:hypothetical protein
MQGEMKAKIGGKVYIGMIAVLAIALLYVLYTGYSTTGNFIAADQATKSVKEVYKLLSERDVEVLSVKDDSGIYKVVLRTFDAAGNSYVQDVFVTKDGKYITDRLVDAENYTKTLAANRDFIACLTGKELFVVGQASNNYTQIQMQLLGDFSYKIYLDCTGDNVQACQDMGVVNIPSVIYNRTIYEGLKPVDWFEQLTGCRAQQ